jgi:1,4-alpha-glucan branching enzyme
VQYNYRLGVPQPGVYRERINTDALQYGGSGVGLAGGQISAEAVPWLGKPHSLALTLPPLATVFLSWQA